MKVPYFSLQVFLIGWAQSLLYLRIKSALCRTQFACSVEGGRARWASSSTSKLDWRSPSGNGCEGQGYVRCCGSTWCSDPGACSWHSWQHEIKLARKIMTFCIICQFTYTRGSLCVVQWECPYEALAEDGSPSCCPRSRCLWTTSLNIPLRLAQPRIFLRWYWHQNMMMIGGITMFFKNQLEYSLNSTDL